MSNSLYKPSPAKRSSVYDPVPNGRKAARQLSILLADDTPAYQKFMSQVLQDRGHVVTHVNDGNHAVQQLEQQHFDVIVVDVQMPYMNGFELARWIRTREAESQRTQRTPIVAMTAHSEPSARSESTAAGIDAYLTKPIDIKHFVDVIEELASHPLGPPMKKNHSKTTPVKGAAGSAHTGKSHSGPIVDYAGAMVRLGGDQQLFREFVAVYDEDVPTLMEALRNALRGHDREGVERNAHSVRGLISNFGARRAVETAAQMEEVAKTARWQDADTTFEKLEREIKLLSEALQCYRTDALGG
jgi:two-component system sensor histidine kinase/response regulator